MKLNEQQMACDEQAAVLSSLATQVASDGCRLLEVGSWCGNSAIVLGNIAREKNGKLFCIDWWKGNPGVELETIAHDYDVFSIFWNNIKKAGLEDYVIPIRGRSDDVGPILAQNSFDLIYIDADHRYESVKNDILIYSSLLKDKGVLCGDDCEGYISDYDLDFLTKHKDIDCHESVHCGVVLAVGEYFENYSLNYSVWSATKNISGWASTKIGANLSNDVKQVPPPLIHVYRRHNFIRLGKIIYAIPQTMGNIDVFSGILATSPTIFRGTSIEELQLLIDSTVTKTIYTEPRLLESNYFGYNIVGYLDKYHAVAMELGHIDLASVEPDFSVDDYKYLSSQSLLDLKKHVRLANRIRELESEKSLIEELN